MKLLDRLSYKYSKYGIKRLILYICTLMATVFVIEIINPGFIYNLVLYREGVLAGEFWRLFTFVLVPPNLSIIFGLISIFFTYFIGNTLERNWGTFKFNVYYFTGMILNIIMGMLS